VKLQVYIFRECIGHQLRFWEGKRKRKRITHGLNFLQVQRVNKGKGFESLKQKEALH
jgi:hypothetical protein